MKRLLLGSNLSSSMRKRRKKTAIRLKEKCVRWQCKAVYALMLAIYARGTHLIKAESEDKE